MPGPQSGASTRWAQELAQIRQRTLLLVSELEDQQLTAVYSSLLSPLAWDLGHIAAYEDLWISRTLGLEPLRPQLTAVYDADETPRALRGDLPILSPADARAFMDAVRERTLTELAAGRPPAAGRSRQADIVELVARHELQHTETMMQALQIAHLPLPAGWERSRPQRTGGEPRAGGFVEVAGGPATIGAGPEQGFAYDNERPRHTVPLKPFLIASEPVSNAQWQRFIDDGGYAAAEHWSADGWRWRQQEAASGPLYWTADGREWIGARQLARDPGEPVHHVCWWEAQAFAKWAGARLPTEFEWEAAIRSQPLAGGHGQVWEWTASEFSGYDGFVSYPYREYSEQFFDSGYRVLRGGSWATSPRLSSPSFRNWDLPQRRQIFSGLRLARDL